MSRRMGWAVAGAGVAVVLAGSVVSQAISPASSSQALSTDLSSVVPDTAPAAPSATPGTPAARLSVSPVEIAVLEGGPTIAITCPGGDTVAAPQFGHRITSAAPYTVTIDYGDGDQYSNDDQHLDEVFTHKYLKHGTFTVAAVLKDATGKTATATCTYSWARTQR